MPYDLSWYNEDKTILQVHIHGDPTWEGWYEAVGYIVARISEQSHSVDLVYLDRGGVPSGSGIPYLQKGLNKLWAEPQLGEVIVVTQPGIGLAIRIVINAVLRTFGMVPGRSAHYVSSMEEALAYIQQSREKNSART